MNEEEACAAVRPHMAGGTEWQQGNDGVTDKIVNYEVGDAMRKWAEVRDQLDVLERTQWPTADYVLLVLEAPTDSYRIQSCPRKK